MRVVPDQVRARQQNPQRVLNWETQRVKSQHCHAPAVCQTATMKHLYEMHQAFNSLHYKTHPQFDTQSNCSVHLTPSYSSSTWSLPARKPFWHNGGCETVACQSGAGPKTTWLGLSYFFRFRKSWWFLTGLKPCSPGWKHWSLYYVTLLDLLILLCMGLQWS